MIQTSLKERVWRIQSQHIRPIPPERCRDASFDGPDGLSIPLGLLEDFLLELHLRMPHGMTALRMAHGMTAR